MLFMLFSVEKFSIISSWVLLHNYIWHFVSKIPNVAIYPQIAMYGDNFCVATCKVVNLLLRNIIRTVIKDNIVWFLLFLGEVCIVAIVGE